MEYIEIILKIIIWIVFVCFFLAMMCSIRLQYLMNSFINKYDKNNFEKRLNYFSRFNISIEEVIKDFSLDEKGVRDLKKILKYRKIVFRLFLPFIIYVLFAFLIFLLVELYT